MILKTKDFQETCKTILLAVDGTAADLELRSHNNWLYLTIANQEYYVSNKVAVTEAVEAFRAVVPATIFLDLVSGLTSEDFELSIDNNTVVVKTSKSSYKIPMIFNNEDLIEVPVIKIDNVTVQMPIKQEILNSIVQVNSKELQKLKGTAAANLNELQKLYYITDEGCFTFATGACLNTFSLEKPIKILVNDRIVKLFKLFKSDVNFTYGVDEVNGSAQSKICLQTDSLYLCAVITNDNILLNKVVGPYTATKNYLTSTYENNVVVSIPALSTAVNRLWSFMKNNINSLKAKNIVVAKIELTHSEMKLSDDKDNTEVLSLETGSFVSEDNFIMNINLLDLKLILDANKLGYLTINCGSAKSVVITKDGVSNVIPKVQVNYGTN